jgi:hypothetical protein
VTASVLVASILFLARPAVAGSSDPVAVARAFMSRTYLPFSPYVGATLDATLVAAESPFAPAQVKVHIRQTGQEDLVAILDVYEGRVEYLAVTDRPPQPAAADSARRVRAALSALEALNGWRCDSTLVPSKRPAFRETSCRDPHPPRYSVSHLVTVVFTDPGGELTMLGAPGPPRVRSR